MALSDGLNACPGTYLYTCKDIDAAMNKLGEVEMIMDWWMECNEGYEYKTAILLGEDSVIIELTIFE